MKRSVLFSFVLVMQNVLSSALSMHKAGVLS